LVKNKNKMSFDNIITELVALEYEVTLANMNGHKASDDDEYAGKRKRVGELRKMLNELENGVTR